jgi:protein-tyrosine phosphatase
MSFPIVDLHTHVLPGVDDGARDLEESMAAISTLVSESVTTVVATPHFRASLQEQPERAERRLEFFDAAWRVLLEEIEEHSLEIELGRACELKLDAPQVALDDERLRLAGTSFVLVEFAAFQLPPFGGNQLGALCEAGFTPVMAHPERYAGIAAALHRPERWRQNGTLFQVNAGSLVGRYGGPAQAAAREFLRRGWVDLLASDYHARGEPELATVRDRLISLEGGAEIAELLMSTNPTRLLAGQPPLEVSPFELSDSSRWSELRRWLR